MTDANTGLVTRQLKNEQGISLIFIKKETIADGNTFIPAHTAIEKTLSKPLILRIFAACKFLKYEQKRKGAGGDEWRY
jgi:hypothetical protein